jgi:AraC-like DNA-binding protein
MHTLFSSAPRPELKPHVRAFAQRKLENSSIDIVQTMPASLEQVLEFEFGESSHLELNDGQQFDTYRIEIIGSRSHLPGRIRLRAGVETFAIFFQPLGFWQLFGIPNGKLANWHFHARDVIGNDIEELWEKMAHARIFEQRVALAEAMLLKRMSKVQPNSLIMSSAQYLFRNKGMPRVSEVAGIASLSPRQFERRFVNEMGVTPKLFAKVTRFQMVLDARIKEDNASWLTLAHQFGYHDQMHMIRDFRALTGLTPDSLLNQVGDMRPPALAGSATQTSSA